MEGNGRRIGVDTFRKRLFLIVGALLLFLVSTGVGYLYFTLSRMVTDQPQQTMLSPTSSSSAFNLTALPTPPPSPGINLLLVGYGGPEHAGGGLSDTLVVLHIDPERKRVTPISVPRDLWVPLQTDGGTGMSKINQAYARGGGASAARVVGAVTGLPIAHFVAVDFDGFQEAIDLLGGVEVDVPVAFDDPWFPVPGLENDPCGKTPQEVEEILRKLSGFEIDKQFPCRFEQIYFDAGPVLMNGETALKFARSRHSAQHGGDFARSERAVALLLGIKEKLFLLGAQDDAISFFNRLSQAVRTDIDEEALRTLLGEMGDVQQYSTHSIYLTADTVLSLATRDGQSVLLPKAGDGKWEGVREYIREQIEGE